MPELIIISSASISLMIYIIISKKEQSFVNFYIPIILLNFPIAYILELYHIFYFGYTNSIYAYFFCYLIYSFKDIIFLLAYLFFKRNIGHINHINSYVYHIKFSPYIFMIIGLLLYLPMIIEFKDMIFLQPRQVYMLTRIGYGLNYSLSVTCFYIGFIILLIQEKYFTKKVYFFIFLGIIFIYLHANKYQYLILFFIIIYYKVYILKVKYSFLKTLKSILVISTAIIVMFYVNYKDYDENVDFNNLMINISMYSDYNRNFMKVIDDFPDVMYGKLTFEDYVYTKIPRQIFPDKPKDFGSRYLTYYYYPEWFYAEAGDPIFGYGIQYADFKELMFVYVFITVIFKVFVICFSIRFMGGKYTIIAFFSLLTATGLPLIITGTGDFIIETILLGYIINKIILIKIKY